MHDIRLILDNIRSTYNVGSIFRTADAAGVSKIYCLGITPAPVDRFGRKRRGVSKVSLGAEDTIVWEHITAMKEATLLIKKLKKEGFTIMALEQDERSVPVRSLQVGKRLAIILGNEVGGVSKDLLKSADIITEIPMKGKKESLNVSVATGILLFQIIK